MAILKNQPHDHLFVRGQIVNGESLFRVILGMEFAASVSYVPPDPDTYQATTRLLIQEYGVWD